MDLDPEEALRRQRSEPAHGVALFRRQPARIAPAEIAAADHQLGGFRAQQVQHRLEQRLVMLPVAIHDRHILRR